MYVKKCLECMEIKDLSQFRIKEGQRVGVRGICIQCYNELRRNDV